jgi:hypothetical protein
MEERGRVRRSLPRIDSGVGPVYRCTVRLSFEALR